MILKKAILFLLCFLNVLALSAQNFSISGQVQLDDGSPLVSASVFLENTKFGTLTDEKGNYFILEVPPGNYRITTSYLGKTAKSEQIRIRDRNVVFDFKLSDAVLDLEEVIIENQKASNFGITRLRAVEGTAIYAAKKNEVVVLEDVTANLAANVSRQIYAKVAGLNIWESDGAGIQLGIGGRGLSPNRNSNFNTRQNGYDISADALGYPESYYTPPVEAIERIEIVRGAASLQYGTQFGGMLNFRFKEGPRDKKIELHSRQTLGSFGLYNSFNSLGGTVGKIQYYGFYHHKRTDGWRPNSSLDQHTTYLSVAYRPSARFTIRPEYTYMQYLAQQPGGLTDAQFNTDPRQSNRERNWFRVNWNLLALNVDYKISEKTRINNRSFALIAGRDALGNLDRINLIDFGGNRDFLSDQFRNWGNETRLIHNYTLFNNPTVFLLGSRIYQGMTHRRQGDGNKGSGPDFYYLNPENLEGSDFDLPSSNFSLFAENIFNLSEKWSLTPGFRFESIHTETDGYYKSRVEDLAGNVLIDEKIEERKSNRRSFVFFGIGSSYKPNEQLELYANISQNYRAINFNDIRVNVGSLVVDPELKDETGFNADLGFRGNLTEVFNFDLSIFYLSYRDRIGSILKKEPNPQFNGLVERVVRFRTNVADARISGLESFLELDLLRLTKVNIARTRLSVFGNFAFIRANYTNSEENGITDNEVELVPPINLKTGLSFQWRDISLSYQYAFVGEHFSDASNAIRTPSAIEGLIPSYQVMDLSLSYRFKFLELEGGINNLSNSLYFTRRATGYPGPGIIPSDGRSFYLTLGFTFGKK